MIHAYSADYLMHAQQTLGGMLLAGVYLFDVPADEFWSGFISTGYAARFGKGADLYERIIPNNDYADFKYGG